MPIQVMRRRVGQCWNDTVLLEPWIYCLLGHPGVEACIPWKSMGMALLDSILRRFKVVKLFTIATLRKPPDLGLRLIQHVILGLKFTCHKPRRSLGRSFIRCLQLITWGLLVQAVCSMDQTRWEIHLTASKSQYHAFTSTLSLFSYGSGNSNRPNVP